MASVRLKLDKEGLPRSYEARVIIKGHPALSSSFSIEKATPSKLEAAKRAAEKKAIAWAAEQERLIRGGDKVSKTAAKTTVAEAIEEYLAFDEESIGNATYKSLSAGKKYCLGNVAHHVGVFTVEGMTRERIQKFINSLLKLDIPPPANRKVIHPLYDGAKTRTYSQSTVRKYYFALKEALTWHARKHRYTLGDKFEGLAIPKSWAGVRSRRLEEGEEKLLIDATKGMTKSPESYQFIIELALETAMRAQELLGLLWSELYLKKSDRFILLPADRTKGSVSRQVSLSSRALEILKQLEALRDKKNTRVFHLLPNNTTLLDKGFKMICKRAGVEDLKFHDLRHEATSRMFENTDLQTVEIMLITGHTQVDTLRRYANIRPHVLADKLDGGRP